MSRFDFSRDHMKRKLHVDQQRQSRNEIRETTKTQTASIIKGMGKGRYSPQANQHMGAEPVRHVDPKSPEGQAIIARLSLPP